MPSRTDVPEYAEYLERIEALVAVVNHRHGTPDWMPIQLKLRDDLEEAVAAYKHYDVLLVNAMFDGMNLVAKEGPLVNERDGVSILSENTGAHEELGEFALSRQPVRHPGARRLDPRRADDARRRSAPRRLQGLQGDRHRARPGRLDRRAARGHPQEGGRAQARRRARSRDAELGVTGSAAGPARWRRGGGGGGGPAACGRAAGLGVAGRCAVRAWRAGAASVAARRVRFARRAASSRGACGRRARGAASAGLAVAPPARRRAARARPAPRRRPARRAPRPRRARAGGAAATGAARARRARPTAGSASRRATLPQRTRRSSDVEVGMAARRRRAARIRPLAIVAPPLMAACLHPDLRPRCSCSTRPRRTTSARKILADAEAMVTRGGDDRQQARLGPAAHGVRDPPQDGRRVPPAAVPRRRRRCSATLQRTLRITDGVVRFRIIKLAPGTPDPPAARPSRAPVEPPPRRPPPRPQPPLQPPSPPSEPRPRLPLLSEPALRDDSCNRRSGGSGARFARSRRNPGSSTRPHQSCSTLSRFAPERSLRAWPPRTSTG